MESKAWPGSYTDRAINSVVKSSRMPFLWTTSDTKGAFYTSLIPVGAYITGHMICSGDRQLGTWLNSLRKPDWAPRDLKSACCMGDLLTMAPLGYATYKTFKTGGGFDYRDTQIAMGLFGANMLFYLGKAYCLSQRDLKCLHLNKLFLSVTALGAAYLYGKIDTNSGYCWIPYCFWTLFGTILSYNLWKKNEDTARE
uniref:Uncharacterized protein n=1 Tax=Acrobeloides nanus TaxID=290746 RepID=A0A914DPJ9_9BILA